MEVMFVLPPGLRLCPLCRDPRGRTTDVRRSLCFCEGLWCSYCRADRIRRPISDHFDPRDGKWWHTPWFGSRAPCRQCQLLGRTVEPGCRPWPGPLRDPGIELLLATVRDAAVALRTPTTPLAKLDEPPPGALLALHAPPDAWLAQTPRNGGPRTGGRSPFTSAERADRWVRRPGAAAMTVATWNDTAPIAVDAVEAEPQRRWPAIPRRPRRQNRAASRDRNA